MTAIIADFVAIRKQLTPPAEPGNDPIIALIADFYRKEKIAGVASARADRVLFALPKDVKSRKARIVIGSSTALGRAPELVYVSSEAEINSHFRPKEDGVRRDLEKALKMECFLKASCDDLLNELRAAQMQVERAYEASGHAVLAEQAETLQDQADEALAEIEEMQPVTLGGVDALLKLRHHLDGPDCDSPILRNVLTWLRAAVGDAERIA